MPKLEDWTLITRTDLYGKKYQQLIGNVYGHPRADRDTGELCDGNNIMTNKLVSLDLDNGIAVTRSGTVYELGVKSNVEGL